MRNSIKIPRIIKINSVKGLKISVMFNNGESRIVDFEAVLKEVGVTSRHPAAILRKPAEFKKVSLENNTLSWSNVKQFITGKDQRKIQVPFEVGADVLYERSTPDLSSPSVSIGKLLREARQRSKMTQEELASRSGTTSNYISRIENDRSDIEVSTLRKIVEAGLGKHLELKIK